MLRVYFSDEENPYVRGMYYPNEGVLYINIVAHRDAIIMLITEEPLIA